MNYKQGIYTIYDSPAGQAGPPFLAVNDDIAIRKTAILLKDQLFVTDFRLYKIGEYDSETCTITASEVKDKKEIDFFITLYNLKGQEDHNDKKSI